MLLSSQAEVDESHRKGCGSAAVRRDITPKKCGSSDTRKQLPKTSTICYVLNRLSPHQVHRNVEGLRVGITRYKSALYSTKIVPTKFNDLARVLQVWDRSEPEFGVIKQRFLWG